MRAGIGGPVAVRPKLGRICPQSAALALVWSPGVVRIRAPIFEPRMALISRIGTRFIGSVPPVPLVAKPAPVGVGLRSRCGEYMRALPFRPGPRDLPTRSAWRRAGRARLPSTSYRILPRCDRRNDRRPFQGRADLSSVRGATHLTVVAAHQEEPGLRTAPSGVGHFTTAGRAEFQMLVKGPDLSFASRWERWRPYRESNPGSHRERVVS